MKSFINFLFGRKVKLAPPVKKLPDYLVRHMTAQDAGMFNPLHK